MRKFRRFGVGAHDPQPGLLEQTQRAREVGDHGDRRRLGRARPPPCAPWRSSARRDPSGITTASAPQASAVRRQAPRLCGSCTPSSTSTNGGLPGSFSSCAVIARHQFLFAPLASGSTSTNTPWCTASPNSCLNTAGARALHGLAGLLRQRLDLRHRADRRALRRWSRCVTRSACRVSSARTACSP